MRVLCVIDSLLQGGAEASLAAVAPHLVERGIDVEVAYLRPRLDLAARFEAAGVALTSIEGGGGPVGAVRRTRALIAARRPDLVHTTLYEADQVGRVAARLAGVPVVTSLVNVAYGDEQRAALGTTAWKLRLARTIDMATARLARRFHAISDEVRTTMADRLRIPGDRIDVIPRGRDGAVLGRRSEQRRAAARGALGIEAGVPLVLGVARQERQKGLDVLLGAWAAVIAARPAARLVIAGREGNDTPMLQAQIDELRLGDTVRFLGRRDDVSELLAAADVFVLPSRWEGLGSVLIEAMALEAPIVASDLPAVRELLVSGDHALLTPPEDASALARSIGAVIDDPSAARERARAARTRFEASYEIGVIADRTASFYRRALDA